MAIRVSFSDIEKKDFSPIPPGVYPVVVADVNESNSVGASGYSYYTWEFEIQAGEYEGRKLWSNTSLSPKAASLLMELLEALGEDPEMLKDPDGFEFEPADYIGTELKVTVKLRPYQGDLKNEVKSYHSATSTPETKQAPTFGSARSATTAPKSPGKKGLKIR